MTELVTFKLQENILKNIDRILKPMNYNNRTEFLREAIRDKLKEIERQEIEQDLRRVFGKAKTKTTDAQLRKAREEVFEEYAKKFGIRLD